MRSSVSRSSSSTGASPREASMKRAVCPARIAPNWSVCAATKSFSRFSCWSSAFFCASHLATTSFGARGTWFASELEKMPCSE